MLSIVPELEEVRGRHFRPKDMYPFSMEFENEEQLRACQKLLVEKHSFTGEMTVRPREDGTWRLSAYSEKRFRESTLDALPGRRDDES